MGAWGTGPLENDSALDWMGDVMESLVPRIEAVLTQASTVGVWSVADELRASASLVVDNAYYSSSIFDLAEKLKVALTLLLSEEDWISGWQDQDEIRQSLQAQIAQLEGVQ